jgi:glycosyltransferase involved in cell wall biosynthesis
MITVLIPSRDRPKLLGRCLNSLVTQNFTDLEFIVLDDSRREESIEKNKAIIKKDSRAKHLIVQDLIGVRKSGIGEILNLGVARSNGDIIARIDDDDLSLPGRINYQLKELTLQNLDLHGTQAINIDRNYKYLSTSMSPKNGTELQNFFVFENPFVHSSVMFKKSKFLDIGGYDESLSTSQDYDLWLRMINGGFRCEISNRKFVVIMRWSESLTESTNKKERQINITKIRPKLELPESDWNWVFGLRFLISKSESKAEALKYALEGMNLKRLILIFSALQNEISGRIKYIRHKKLIRSLDIEGQNDGLSL